MARKKGRAKGKRGGSLRSAQPNSAPMQNDTRALESLSESMPTSVETSAEPAPAPAPTPPASEPVPAVANSEVSTEPELISAISEPAPTMKLEPEPVPEPESKPESELKPEPAVSSNSTSGELADKGHKATTSPLQSVSPDEERSVVAAAAYNKDTSSHKENESERTALLPKLQQRQSYGSNITASEGDGSGAGAADGGDDAGPFRSEEDSPWRYKAMALACALLLAFGSHYAAHTLGTLKGKVKERTCCD
ncbi:hypothetical protein THASP1DRAFT_32105 [Thamnocephalis sphaerospora]|uniref:Uncharacterized protein n=1 Tax=Thamnocephalis sphaerospora TaxID=78915 RepID=A0A4P9XLB7_9FUNG|nr:hypothetical protein THASP1DRAFT_32105 [Thamnocephalis sphaerospora]|eukprot:RKP06070.1 hypothetical protein THASP1DRAFT_32105 [Thamnocephalis sphaerospora]